MIKLASEKNHRCLEKGKRTVGYLLAGYPEREDFFEVLSECETAGLDIFEIGYPSENPNADGDVIRKAHSAVDLSIQKDRDYWRRIRKTVDSPIWIMAYSRDLIDSGFYKVLAKERLADALVIPDITLKRRLALKEELKAAEIDILGFVSPDMEKDEQEACFQAFPLVYQQLYSGPTGLALVSEDFEELLGRGKAHKDLKVFAGFGIHSVQRATQLLESGFDGVIIGTAMIARLNSSKESLVSFVKNLNEAVRKEDERCG